MDVFNELETRGGIWDIIGRKRTCNKRKDLNLVINL